MAAEKCSPDTWTLLPDSPQARALEYVAAQSRGVPMPSDLPVTLHFHPDRQQHGVSVMQALAHEGIYRSQFETGTSNGSLTGHLGGMRWSWESRIFGGAYDDAPPFERPKYAALNHRRCPFGGAPRFGSAYLRLKPETLVRTTFCYPDSVFEPSSFGVVSRMALLAIAAVGQADPLDDYIEAHVHGPVRLGYDVEALVLDPCYKGTEVESFACELPCPVEWHPGYRLGVSRLREVAAYRGSGAVILGQAVAREECVTAAVIGDAARTGLHAEEDLKKLWHCVARFGQVRPG